MFRYDEGLKLMVKGKVTEETFPEIQSVLTEQIRIPDTGRVFQNSCDTLSGLYQSGLYFLQL